MLDYQILYVDDHNSAGVALAVLEEKVKEYIHKGYSPLGGVSITDRIDIKALIVAQAMIKEI